jgi:hypothetical protein
LWSAPSIESFCWRIEQQIGEGGFALAIGDPGTGKSATLRILAEHLGNLRDVVVGVFTTPEKMPTLLGPAKPCAAQVNSTAGVTPIFTCAGAAPS